MKIIPPLRNVDAVPVEHEGQELICLHDPAGYVEDQVLLSPPAFFIAACFDGESDAEAVQRAFAGQFGGAQVPIAQIEQVAAFLDEQGYLLSPRFEARAAAIESAFRDAPVRPASLAGKSYPKEPEALRAFLEGMFTEPDGPGAAPHTPRNCGRPPMRGLIVPHIDFQRGGAAYAQGYHRLFAEPPPRRVLLFGVAHAAAPVPFILTRKDFDTPLGCLPTDRDAVDRLAAACDWNPYAFEAVHRTEHSLEFQAVMLAWRYGDSVPIVPVLCSAFSADPATENPEELPAVQRFLAACQALAGDGALAIAGADLAHVGRRFGDDFDIDGTVVREVAARDDEDLAHVLRGQAAPFFRSVMKDGNRRKVCGLGCIYAALKSLDGRVRTGETLHYGYAPDPAGGIVSFASIALY